MLAHVLRARHLYDLGFFFYFTGFFDKLRKKIDKKSNTTCKLGVFML